MLQIQDLSLSLARQKILNGLNLDGLMPGQLCALIGPNGTGKSTLFRAISGLLPTDSGTLLLDGENLKHLSGKERARRVCYVPQLSNNSVMLSVFDALLLALRAGGRGKPTGEQESKVVETLSLLGLTDKAHSYLSELSGGQRQLVALGQALIREPRVLLLDEPTSALDLAHQLKVMELLCKVVKEKQLICMIAIHDLNLASRYCQQLVAIRDGKVLAQGEIDQALSPQLIAELFGLRVNKIPSSLGYQLVEAVAICG